MSLVLGYCLARFAVIAVIKMQKGNITEDMLGNVHYTEKQAEMESRIVSTVRAMTKRKSVKDRQIEWSEDTHACCRVSLGGMDLMRPSHRRQRATVYTITQ